eukprot:NODE_697_length_5080_cov_0.072877.p3 type:complete len:150 gc:universal NODE_697_length_5080_cov_0.072877:3243-2794(-)
MERFAKFVNMLGVKSNVIFAHLVDEDSHCDVPKLRRLLISDNMADLIESTHVRHFAQYRAGFMQHRVDGDIENQANNAKDELAREMQEREERMRANFMTKVRQKEAELKEKEEKLSALAKKLQSELDEEKRKIDLEEKEVRAQIEVKKK